MTTGPALGATGRALRACGRHRASEASQAEDVARRDVAGRVAVGAVPQRSGPATITRHLRLPPTPCACENRDRTQLERAHEMTKEHALEWLSRAFEDLLAQPRLERDSEQWKNSQFAEWQEHFERSGVYVLWLERQERPLYVGEGGLGGRTHVHHTEKPHWTHGQVWTHDDIQGAKGSEGQRRRKLLERFAILVLDPVWNLD